LTPSFVPPPEIRRLRLLTRYRVQLMGDKTRDLTRLELMLEDASIKLSSVASSLKTVSARAMLAAMESTSTYWKPPFYCLEEVMQVWLVNAAHMKAVPGRKSDVRDAEWIAQLLEHGLLTPSFVPPPEIRRLRLLTRYRVQLMGDKTRDLTRLELMLEDASIKLWAVASSWKTVSVSTREGVARLDALVGPKR